ncbi:hypothetical protein JXB28_00970 [Candidatus Woesearchaeota archaeon]|nr:hypothetical protein [Candidatus Woesearchaeota archaeon]
MLYIHQLKDLTQKSADIESIFILRELKQKTPLPLTELKIMNYFSLFFVSESEKNSMSRAYSLIDPAVQDLIHLAKMQDPDFEPINLKRAVDMLREIPQPLINNLNYAKEVGAWQEGMSKDFAPLLNSIPHLGSQQERISCNDKLNAIFEKLLRTKDMAFNYRDIINEAQTARITNLNESLSKGFLFRTFLEEEIKKHDFSIIRNRIAPGKLEAVERINARVGEIKKGVEAAYEVNRRMIVWALNIYAYIRWMTTPGQK